MWRRMAVFTMLAAVVGCPGNPTEPEATSEHPGLAVVSLTGSLSRTDTLQAFLAGRIATVFPGADTVFTLDVFMGPRDLITDSSPLFVSLSVQPPARYATGTFPIEPDGGTFVVDTLGFSFDPDAPDFTFSSTNGEVEITANSDSLVLGRFDFDAADGTGRTIRAVGTFDARLLSFGPTTPPGPRGGG